MIEITELEALKNIVVKRVAEQLGDPNLNACKLLNALAELTVHDASEPDIGWDNAKYHSTRLAVELGNAKNDSDKDRRYINRIWKDMIEAYEVIEPSIENDVRKAGFRKILKPRKTDPKTGRVEFYLDVQDVEETNTYHSEKESTISSGFTIDYELVKRPKLSLWGKIFSRIVWYKPIYIIYKSLPIIMVILFGAGIEYLNLSVDLKYVSEVILFMLICIHVAYVFRAFYRVGQLRIVQAPIWMTKLTPGEEAQLQLQTSGKKNSLGEDICEIALVVYLSRCPICESAVKVDNGARKFKGRLIGKCELNPVEHIYSFDYVTRKGVPLRNDTYLG